MSVRCTGWVWDHSPTTGNDRIVLLFIADQADDDGTNAFPSIERIAIKSNLPVRTVMRCVDRMETTGAIRVIRPVKRGRGRFNRYVVVMGQPEKDDSLSCGKPMPDGPVSGENSAPETREHSRKHARPYLDGHRSLDPLTHNPLPDGSADNSDEPPPDLRAGVEVETQETPTPAGPDLLAALAAAAPPAARYELLDDPDQAAGRSALRRRLSTLAAAVGPDAAVAVVASEWPAAVASPMAHANARARAALEPRPAPSGSWRPVADPLDGITDAAAAIAERARAREDELAAEPPLVVPSGWKAELRGQLYRDAEISR